VSEGWRGDPGEFGKAIAILLGDLLLVWSDAMLAGSGLDADALARARPVAETMRVELMAGQYLDVVEQARGGGSVDRALRVARYKAAKYTVERPLHLGVAIGDGAATVGATMSAYGLPLGEAFQLRDDLLGVFGDPDVTGKPAGDDFREGKRTVLIALATEAATPAGREALESHLGDPDLDDAGAARLLDAVRATGADHAIEQMISDRVGSAVAALRDAGLDPIATDALISLAGAATRRSD
jgi:geranylgeranyl diphosphate synthase type I